MWPFGGKLLQVEERALHRAQAKQPRPACWRARALGHSEWGVVANEVRQWGLPQSAWEVTGPALGFSPREKGSHLSLRVEWWLGFIYVYRNISCCVYVWWLFSILALFIAIIRCFVELKSPATKFVKHLSIQNRCTCWFRWFCSCIQTILDQISFKFIIPALLALNPKYFQLCLPLKHFHHIISLLKNHSAYKIQALYCYLLLNSISKDC